MSLAAKYSLLKYRHSYLLEEVLNVGLLCIVPDQKAVHFLFPGSLSRISSLYNDFHAYQLKYYLEAFQKKANKLRDEWSLGLDETLANNPQEFIAQEFLLPDATALFFGEVKQAEGKDIDSLTKSLFTLYFSNYEAGERKAKHDEKYIIRTFRNKLLKKNREIDKYLKKDIIVSNGRNTSETFQYGWQNGTLNLVSPLSFDLSDSSAVQKKAVSTYGLLNLLGQVADEKKYRFDLLIAKPRYREVFKAYEHAIDILSDLKAPSKLIFEENLEVYTDKAIEALTENHL